MRRAGGRTLSKDRTPPQGSRRILLVDCDSFFVQVARLEDPEGAGRHPLLLVGGRSNRGVITSASYAVRDYGVRSGMPTSRALQLCPEALVVPVPRGAVVERSRAVRAVLGTLSPVVQAASIDEFYLDLTGTERMLKGEDLARHGRPHSQGSEEADRGHRIAGWRDPADRGQGGNPCCQAERRARGAAGRRGRLHVALSPVGPPRDRSGLPEAAVRKGAPHQSPRPPPSSANGWLAGSGPGAGPGSGSGSGASTQARWMPATDASPSARSAPSSRTSTMTTSWSGASCS